MRVLMWHVHGSWATAFVHGPQTTLVPVTPGRGADGRGRARTFHWPDRAVEVAPEQLRHEPTRRRRPAAAARAASSPRSGSGRRPGRDVPAVYVEHNAPPGTASPRMRHPRRRPRTTSRSCTSPTSTAVLGLPAPTPSRSSSTASSTPGTATPARCPAPAWSSTSRVRRGRVTGTDLLARLRGGGAPRPVRHGRDRRRAPRRRRVADVENLPQARLHEELARRRVYVHPYPLDLARPRTARGHAPRHAGGGARHHRGGRGGAAGGRGASPPTSTRWPAPRGRLRRRPARGAAPAGKEARAAALDRYGLPRFLRDWDGGLLAGGDAMRIAMVSEHASPLAAARAASTPAGRTSTSPHSPPAWRRPRPRRHRVHPARRPRRCRAGCRCAPGVDGRPRRRPGRPARPQGRPAAAHAGVRPPPRESAGPTEPPDVVHAHFWMCGLAALAAARGARRPGACRPSTRSAPSSGATRATADTSPAEPDRGWSARSAATPTASIATCTDEVAELRRHGRADRGASQVVPVRRRPRARSARTARPRRAAAGHAPARRVGRLVERKGVDTVDPGPARSCPDAELVVAGGRARRASTPTRGAPAARARRASSASPTGWSSSGGVGRGDVARADAVGRRRGCTSLVRAVRHRAAGGDGLRRAGRRLRRRRPPRHRRRRRHRRRSSRPGVRTRSRRALAALLDRPRRARRVGARGRRPGAEPRTRGPRVAAATAEVVPARRQRSSAVADGGPR